MEKVVSVFLVFNEDILNDMVIMKSVLLSVVSWDVVLSLIMVSVNVNLVVFVVLVVVGLLVMLE